MSVPTSYEVAGKLVVTRERGDLLVTPADQRNFNYALTAPSSGHGRPRRAAQEPLARRGRGQAARAGPGGATSVSEPGSMARSTPSSTGSRSRSCPTRTSSTSGTGAPTRSRAPTSSMLSSTQYRELYQRMRASAGRHRVLRGGARQAGREPQEVGAHAHGLPEQDGAGLRRHAGRRLQPAPRRGRARRHRRPVRPEGGRAARGDHQGGARPRARAHRSSRRRPSTTR